MSDLKNNDTIKVFQGTYEHASYREVELIEYKGNPFIESLPPIFNDDNIFDIFFNLPRVTEEERLKDPNIRFHALKRVKMFTQPLPLHFVLSRRISSLLYEGYLNRNPLNKSFTQTLSKIHEIREEDDPLVYRHLDSKLNITNSTASSLAILGISGMGKTTAVERILQQYPQVIKHTKYENHFLNRTQIVWLKIDCPYDGSLSTLCKNFFHSIDVILGTRYLEKYGYSNRVTSSMLMHMTSLASMYGIGVLVIDEIQHLLNARENQEDMLNFFVTLSNTIGIPTIIIGTSKAQKLFNTNFRQARRVGTDGVIVWDRMSEDSEEWEVFIETLWRIQCLKEETPLTDELKHTMYEACQGITAVAVILFILSQERVMFSGLEKELITTKIIKQTLQEDMLIVLPMLQAIKSNNINEIMKYEDIKLNLDSLMLKHKEQYIYEGRIKEELESRLKSHQLERKNRIDQLTFDICSIPVFHNIEQVRIKKLISEVVGKYPLNTDYNQLLTYGIKESMNLLTPSNSDKKQPENYKKTLTKDTDLILLPLHKKAQKAKKHPYELLKDQGFIKNPLVEFHSNLY